MGARNSSRAPLYPPVAKGGRWGGFKFGLGVLAIGLLFVFLVIWRVNREATVLPEIRFGNFTAIPIGEAQPPVTDFSVKPVSEAASELNPDELVLGVEVAGEARAYPVNMLSGPSREILNDTLGGRPIAATW